MTVRFVSSRSVSTYCAITKTKEEKISTYKLKYWNEIQLESSIHNITILQIVTSLDIIYIYTGLIYHSSNKALLTYRKQLH